MKHYRKRAPQGKKEWKKAADSSAALTTTTIAPMALSELKYIVALARHRHFGRAAEAAFVPSRRCRWR